MPTVRAENSSPIAIGAGAPSIVSSSIEIAGAPGATESVVVDVDVRHTWTRDLTMSLVGPGGTRVPLVTRRGGSGDDFGSTVFDMEAPTSILDGVPPFSGPHRPEGDLAAFRGGATNGTWTLELEDSAYFDGGSLDRWGLTILHEEPTAPAFTIDVRFAGGLSTGQQSAFSVAARRWSEIIIGDLPAVQIDGEAIDDVVVEAAGAPIDGRGGILGQAGPTHLRPNGGPPAKGIMSFDTADLDAMEADGSLVSVVIHEMGHVLGIGTTWDRLGLRQGTGTVNPRYVGANAMREFGALAGEASPRAVPLANTGGVGTRDAHWRESVFGNELMTGFIDAGTNPISRVTIGALQDLGYEVAYDAADAYSLPTALMLALMGVGAEEDDHGGHGVMLAPQPIELGEDCLL